MVVLYYFMLTIGVLLFYLGVVTLIFNRDKLVHKAYPLIAVSLGLILAARSMGEGSAASATEDVLLMFAALATAGVALFFHPFSRHHWSRRWSWAVAVPAMVTLGVITLYQVVTVMTFPDVFTDPFWGADTWLQLLLTAAYTAAAAGSYALAYRSTKAEDRVHVEYIGWAQVLAYLFTFAALMILPAAGITSYIVTAPLLAYAAMVTLVVLALVRHELLNVQIVITETFVILVASVALLNRLLRAQSMAEVALSIIVLLLFLAALGRLFVVFSQIIHEREVLKLHNKQLRELMNMKTQFLQIASHQLRAPLTSLYGLVQLDAAGYFHDLPKDKHQEFHDRMLQSAERLQELVNDLLRALKLEGDDLPLALSAVDVVTLLNESIDTLKMNFEKRGLTIRLFKPARSLPKIQADPDYLRQVFVNLIDNAERYTERGGVTVTPKFEDGHVVIEITDTGIGITPDEKKTMFQKFARGKRATEFQQQGTGLGLFIAQKIIQNHCGTLELSSKGKNMGTTARVVLPLQHPKVHYHGILGEDIKPWSSGKSDPAPKQAV